MKLRRQRIKRTISIEFIGLTLLLLILVSCNVLKNTDEKKYYKEIIPPGTVKLVENLFFDQTEIRNLDWCEYMYWTQRVFGTESEEYRAVLPDTTVWLLKDYHCLNVFEYYYLRHPAYREHPVVGISQKQAEDYAKWRSDRVFEFILIRYGNIKMNPDQNKNNYFTIDKYINGNYSGYSPDSNFKYYPAYRISTIQEWRRALNYADSLDLAFTKKHRSKYIKECNKYWSEIQCDIVPCVNDTLKVDPTSHISRNCSTDDNPQIYNLRGNVREWTNENEICIGGGWTDRREVIFIKDTFQSKTQNAWTGCRNVCEWKKYNK